MAFNFSNVDIAVFASIISKFHDIASICLRNWDNINYEIMESSLQIFKFQTLEAKFWKLASRFKIVEVSFQILKDSFQVMQILEATFEIMKVTSSGKLASKSGS